MRILSTAKNTKPNAIEILTWLKEKECPYKSESLYKDYMHIHIDVLRWLNSNIITIYDDEYIHKYTIVDEYIDDTSFNLFKYWNKNDRVFTKDMYVYAIMVNSIYLVKWLEENSCPHDINTFIIAIEFNNLEIINFLYDENFTYITEEITSCISEYTTLETLKWLHEKDFYLSLSSYVGSVNDGDLDIMEFLYNIDEERWSYYDCDANVISNTLSIAIRGCNLETLQFIYKGYFYKHNVENIIIESIPNSNVGILKFLIENGYSLEVDLYDDKSYKLVSDTIKWDNVEMLKYFVKLGLELISDMFLTAFYYKSARIIHYLYEVNCPRSWTGRKYY